MVRAVYMMTNARGRGSMTNKSLLDELKFLRVRIIGIRDTLRYHQVEYTERLLLEAQHNLTDLVNQYEQKNRTKKT